jgi:hypothetical protein
MLAAATEVLAAMIKDFLAGALLLICPAFAFMAVYFFRLFLLGGCGINGLEPLASELACLSEVWASAVTT